MSEKFPWFAARLLYEACIEEDEGPSLFEERIVVLRSERGAESAEKKAQKLGKAAADEYKNDAKESVAWRFKEVLEIVQLNESSIEDGTEVYHHYLNADEVESVRQSLKSSL